MDRHAFRLWQDWIRTCRSGWEEFTRSIATPYAALIVHASVSLILVIVNFVATGGVQESFQSLLSLAVVLQLIPFLYMFGGLLKIAFDEGFVRGHYAKGTLIFAGVSGLMTTMLGIALAFFPAQQIKSVARLRNLDVRRHGLFYRARGVFFFYLRESQGGAKTGGGYASGLRSLSLGGGGYVQSGKTRREHVSELC